MRYNGNTGNLILPKERAMTLQLNNKPNQKGFTLIELSIVLVITSLILVGAIQAFQVFNEKQKIERINLLIASIDQAISNFPSKIDPITDLPYGRLPCPAPMNGVIAGSDYNIEDCSIVPVSVAGGDPVLVGKIPTATLGLSSGMMRDVYGNHLIYAVTGSSTNNLTYRSTAGAIEVIDEGEDLSLPSTTIPDVQYLVVSTGGSGVGAYAFDGTQPIACAGAGSKDGENCDGDATFISSVRSDPGNVNFYDDHINLGGLTAAPTTLGEGCDGTATVIPPLASAWGWPGMVLPVFPPTAPYGRTFTIPCGRFAHSPGGTLYQCIDNEWLRILETCSYHGPSCFIAGTMVALADGTEKSIERLVAGDVLLGMDGVHNTVIEMEVPFIGDRVLYAFNGGNFFVTAEHPFMLETGQWASIDPEATEEEQPGFEEKYGKIKSLEVGDVVVLKDNKKLKLEIIESRDRYTKTMPVYNPVLDGNHTYYADGFLVHNKM